MANRYDTPARASFVNYVEDVPFQELFQLGSTMAARADKAQKDLADAFKEYSEFSSISNKDTQTYYDETVGRINPVVERLASDPDRIKTMEGRREIANAINGVNYGLLSQLKTSAKNLDERRKLVAEMKSKGLYNEEWDDYADLSSYDTRTGGAFSDLNVTPFQSIADMSESTMNNLKEGYLKGESNRVYDVYGISQDDVYDAAVSAATDIASTPTGLRHISDAIRRGETTDEDAMNWLTNKVYQENAHRARITKKDVNQLYLKDYDHNLAMRRMQAQQKAKDDAKGDGMQGFSRKQMVDMQFQKEFADKAARVKLDPKELSGFLSKAASGLKESDIARLAGAENFEDFKSKVLEIATVSPESLSMQEASALVQSYGGAVYNETVQVAAKGKDVFDYVSVNVPVDNLFAYKGVDVESSRVKANTLEYIGKDSKEPTLFYPMPKTGLRNAVILDQNRLGAGSLSERELTKTSDSSSKRELISDTPWWKTDSSSKNMAKNMEAGFKEQGKSGDMLQNLLTKQDSYHVQFTGATTKISTPEYGEQIYAEVNILLPKDNVKQSFKEDIEKYNLKKVDYDEVLDYSTGDYSSDKSSSLLRKEKAKIKRGSQDWEDETEYITMKAMVPAFSDMANVAYQEFQENKKAMNSKSAEASMMTSADAAFVGSTAGPISNNKFR